MREFFLLGALLLSPAVFSADFTTREIVEHIHVSAIAATPDTLEMKIAKLAKEKNASDWKITSMQINNNGFATAVLYK